MKMLTPEIFTEALTLCGEYGNYKTGIIFDNRNTMKEFIDALRSIGHIPNVRRAITRRGVGLRLTHPTDYGKLEFFNGSIIEIILGTEHALRGRRYNQIITSGAFDEKLYEQMERMSVPYRDFISTNERVFNAALFGMRAHQHTKWELSDTDAKCKQKTKEKLSTEQANETSQELESFLDSFAIKKCE